jgi:ribosome-associated protein
VVIKIPEENLVFRFSRSGGPGGQNVNKVNTRVTVFFDVARCERYSDEQKRRILKRLATRADKNGVVRVVCQRNRTQKANREGAVERLRELLREALKKRRVRKKTKVPAYAREKRLAEKKKRSRLKKQRTEKDFGD